MAPSITATTENDSIRRRSLSGASALLARTFTRQSSAPRPASSRSESTTRRRATIAASTDIPQQNGIKVHVRIVPNIENPSRSLIFDIVDRELQVGSVIRIGRYSERHANLNCMSFKSKVVSRCHSEVWVETDGKLYIRDTKSSSGTFLNHVRLSPAGNESRPVELNDGDIVQLGVDFQGGREEMYRSVKMRFELNRSSRPRPLSFSINAFQNLRNLTHGEHSHVTTPECDISTNNNTVQPFTKNTLSNQESNTTTNSIQCTPASIDNTDDNNDIDECCICLYALAPFQALFVSPCSHTYHFKCIRPLLQSYPGFQCPICRTYSDLEASVAIEADEVMEKYAIRYNKKINDSTCNAPLADSSGSNLQSNIHHLLQENHITTTTVEPSVSSADHGIDQPLHIPPLQLTHLNSPVIYSEPLPDLSPLDTNHHEHPTDNLNHVIDGSSLTNDSIEENGIMSNTDEDDEDYEEHNVTPTEEDAPSRPRERRTSHIMEKIKMVFFEKRKSTPYGSNKNRRSSSNKRPLSYSDAHAGDNETAVETQGSSRRNTSTAAVPLSQTLSRQSTTHLTEIGEEPAAGVVISSYNSTSRDRNHCIQQAMAVDV
ncbi:hypothetical protein INT47_006614 [Mucor saturninus]|uniref:Uncharacterized protein n=1 Tax=Mucor saturninus TaxID=64648 RepID=A0A8H7UTD7_9FUNG|nr:hypothetical protein INT47_006614 [Mucor saturninus]